MKKFGPDSQKLEELIRIKDEIIWQLASNYAQGSYQQSQPMSNIMPARQPGTNTPFQTQRPNLPPPMGTGARQQSQPQFGNMQNQNTSAQSFG